MFKYSKVSPSYYWPVTAGLPADGGQVERVTFDVQFRRFTLSQRKAFNDRILAEKMSDEAVVRELVVGWRGVQDEGDQDIAFSVTLLDRLLDVDGVATAICRAYGDSHDKAAEKN